MVIKSKFLKKSLSETFWNFLESKNIKLLQKTWEKFCKLIKIVRPFAFSHYFYSITYKSNLTGRQHTIAKLEWNWLRCYRTIVIVNYVLSHVKISTHEIGTRFLYYCIESGKHCCSHTFLLHAVCVCMREACVCIIHTIFYVFLIIENSMICKKMNESWQT